MPIDALVAILGMALATYAIRISGFLLADRLPATGFVAAWLKHIPGAVLASLVAPKIINEGGPAEWIAAGVTALVYVLVRNLFAAMVAGVLAVYLARMWLGT